MPSSSLNTRGNPASLWVLLPLCLLLLLLLTPPAVTLGKAAPRPHQWAAATRFQPAAHWDQNSLSSPSSSLHPNPAALKVEYNCIHERSAKSLFKHIYDGHQPPKTAHPASTVTARTSSAVPKMKKEATITKVLDRDPFMRQVKHPNGQLTYLFFLFDGQGRMVQKLMNLQQVQDVFLAHRITLNSTVDESTLTPAVDDEDTQEETGGDVTPSTTPLLVDGATQSATSALKRPALNFAGVIKTIQQVMANEMANTPATEDTPPSTDIQAHYTIPPGILQKLIGEQLAKLQQTTTEEGPATTGVETTIIPNTESPPNSTENADPSAVNEIDRIGELLSGSDDYINKHDKFGGTSTALPTEEVSFFSTGNEVATSEEKSEFVFEEESSYSSYSTSQTTEYIPGFTNTKLSFGEAFTNSNTPTYTLTPMTDVEKDGAFTTETSIHEGIKTATSSHFAIFTSPSNLADFYENLPTEASSLVSDVMATNSIDQGTLGSFTTFQEVSSDDLKVTVAPALNHEIVAEKAGDLPVFSYDYYPDIVQFSNVLPPSQMATDAFKEDMNFEDHPSLPDEYDYYNSDIYLDDATQDYYEKQSHSEDPTDNSHKAPNPSSLDFPGPDVAASYHPVAIQNKSTMLSFSSVTQSRPPIRGSVTVPTTVTHGQQTTTPGSEVGGGPSGQEILDELGVSVRPKTNILKAAPPGHLGLEATVDDLSPKIKEFIAAMNNITFHAYTRAAKLHRSRNFVMSSMNLISVLSMLLLGARGRTSDLLADLLRTDDFRNFNPHLLLKNIYEEIAKNNPDNNIAFTTQMFVEKPRRTGFHSLEFFGRTVDYFYGATVDEAEWEDVGSLARARVNKAVGNMTNGRVDVFLKEDASLKLAPPFSVVSSALLQSRWAVPVTQADLFDMSFIRFPSAERRLVRTLGVTKQMALQAGYSKEADATVAEIPLSFVGNELSMILVLPGEQKSFKANGLKLLEERLSPALWSALLRSMVPHSLTVQVPFFRHRSYTDVSALIQGLELKQLFQEGEADFSGVNGIKSLHLGDVIQLSEFHSCLLANSSFSFRSGEGVFPLGSNQVVFTPHPEQNSKANTDASLGARTAVRRKRSQSSETPFNSRKESPEEFKTLQAVHPSRIIRKRRAGGPASGTWKQTMREADILENGGKTLTSDSLFAKFWSYLHSEPARLISAEEERPDHKVTSIVNSHPQSEDYSENSKNSPPVDHVSRDDDLIRNVEEKSSEKTTDSVSESLRVNSSEKGHSDAGAYTLNKKDDEAIMLPVSDQVEIPIQNINSTDELGKASPSASRLPDQGREDSRHNDHEYRGRMVPTVAFDRAFMYAIRHNPTGLILYLGRYLDPI